MVNILETKNNPSLVILRDYCPFGNEKYLCLPYLDKGKDACQSCFSSFEEKKPALASEKWVL